jgi:hypothetical protein
VGNAANTGSCEATCEMKVFILLLEQKLERLPVDNYGELVITVDIQSTTDWLGISPALLFYWPYMRFFFP